MMELKINENIYPVYLKRSKRIKTSLSVNDNLEIIISSPRNISESEFKRLLKSFILD